MPPRRGEPLACDDEALETARPHLRTDHLPAAAWTGRCRYVAADGTPLRGEASQRLAALAGPMRNLGDRARRRRSLHTAISRLAAGARDAQGVGVEMMSANPTMPVTAKSPIRPHQTGHDVYSQRKHRRIEKK
jgi:hypothetical protein